MRDLRFWRGPLTEGYQVFGESAGEEEEISVGVGGEEEQVLVKRCGGPKLGGWIDCL